MQQQDPGATIAMVMFFVFFAVMIGHGLRHLITGQPPGFAVHVKNETTTARRTPRQPAPRPAQPMPASSLGDDDRLLAGAAKRMGISEEKLREWLAEGRLTIQNPPDPTRQ